MIYYEHNSNFITVVGQTYPHRNTIKSMGGYFVGQTKAWRFPYSETMLSDVDRLCRQHGGGPSDTSSKASAVEPTLITDDEAASLETPAHAPDQNGYRVSELLDIIGASITRAFSSPLWIIGEVQNLNIRAGRGVFFNLAEQANAEVAGSTLSISAVMWGETFSRLEKKFGKEKLRDILQDGLVLRILCQVQFYKGRASVSLSVFDIDPQYTQGALALARETLLKELRSKGQDLRNKQLPLTAFPFKVGLISAENSRAASDFLHQLEQGRFPGEVYFCYASMQGESSPPEVCAAMQRLIEEGCDILVLTRGGGSAADLRWFDTPEIAYAIVQCPVPVLAAIGHHDDRCVAEEICFQREKTPTAAAEFILSCFENAESRIEQCLALMVQRLDQAYKTLFERQNFLKERLKSVANETLVKKQEALVQFSHSFDTQSRGRLSSCERVLSELFSKLQWEGKLRVERLMGEVQKLEQTLKTHDPRPWLERGWTQLWQEQKLVQSVDDIAEGELVFTRLLDGILKLRVVEKVKKETSND